MHQHLVCQYASRLRTSGFSIRAIADVLEVAKTTIHRWIHKSPNRPTITSRPPPECLEAMVEGEPYCSVQSYRDKLSQVSVTACKTTVWKWMRRLGFSKRRTYPGELVNQNLKKQREDFTGKAQMINVKEVICLDETSWYDCGIPRKGWQKAGVRLRVPMVRTIGRRYSSIAAMSYVGDIHYRLHPGSINGKLFSDFVKSIP